MRLNRGNQHVAKAPTKHDQELAVRAESALPAYLQNKQKAVALGNLDQSDLIMPRIKLLQSVSPEVEEFENAKAGHFWHSLAGECLGESLRFIPILVRKSIVLWAPRGDDRGVLARSNDCVSWDRGDETFEVKFKNTPPQKWRLGDSVRDSGLTEFGSSIREEPNSQPAAALTYNFMVYLPDHPEMKLAILLNTRSSVKAAKTLISKIEMANQDQFALKFTVSPQMVKGDGQSYYNYVYARSGYADQDEYEFCSDQYNRFKGKDFRSNDEEDARSGDGDAKPGVTSEGKERF